MTPTAVFTCPRCDNMLPADAFYGPCSPCRVELREIADRRYTGWLAVHFLAGRLTDPKPTVAASGGPGAPAGPSPRALDPAGRLSALQGLS